MLAPEAPSEAGGRFIAVRRSRVLERIARAARYPVTVIAAPAGYGKTVALRHFLEAHSGPVVRYDLRSSEGSLLGFIRGFARAFSAVAPDLPKTVPSAYESSQTSSDSAADLAQWIHAHIAEYRGLAAIDDLHIAQTDPRVDELLNRLVDLTKGQIQWIFASRGAGNLSVASWIAYGALESVIDESDLRMTLDEARAFAKALAPAMADEELATLVQETHAWPTALSFALRTATRSSQISTISATRDLLFRYLAEQVYRTLPEEHVSLLRFAAHFQEIEIGVLEKAGFICPKRALDELQSRTALLYRQPSGAYRLHDLFRDFLIHQADLLGPEAARNARLLAARALESSEEWLSALEIFADAGAQADVLRLLEEHFDLLLDQPQCMVTKRALAVVSPAEFQVRGILVALQGICEASEGRFAAGESLLRQAVAMPVSPEQRARIAVRLAGQLFNQNRDVLDLVVPVAEDSSLSTEIRTLALSYAAPRYAIAGMKAEAADAIDHLLKAVDAPSTSPAIARVLHRAALAAMWTERPFEEVIDLFDRAIHMAQRDGAYLTWAAALSGKSMAVSFYMEDMLSARRLADQAIEIAEKSGARLTLKTCLLLALAQDNVLGDDAHIEKLFQRLSEVSKDSALSDYADCARAFVALRAGETELAFDLLSRVCTDTNYDFDRCYISAFRALSAAATRRAAVALELIDDVLPQIGRWQQRNAATPHRWPIRSVGVAYDVIAVTLCLCGKAALARRMVKRQLPTPIGVLVASRMCARGAVDSLIDGGVNSEFLDGLKCLKEAGYAGIALIYERVLEKHLAAENAGGLTKAEISVLESLAEGLSTKEIASVSGRSVHTVRTLAQRSFKKLGCSGRQAALITAQRRGLIRPARENKGETI